MQVMQYKINLPNDYDMKKIKQRVSQNGVKTDGFNGLLLKAYLIIDKPDKKEYAPLYLWNDYHGMNQFIFEGFYDNILQSFGWQPINIAVPIQIDITNHILSANYVIEIEHPIAETNKMTLPKFSVENKHCLGRALVYNPDKWRSVEFLFFEEMPHELKNIGNIYQVLHMSM